MDRIRTRRRPGLAGLAAAVSVSAWFGVVGLAAGLLPIDATMSSNLPLHSPVLGGIALGAVVALPTTALTWLAWHGHARAPEAATLCGLLLVGWIVVEVLVIRELSVLQAVYAGAGLALLRLGRGTVLRASHG